MIRADRRPAVAVLDLESGAVVFVGEGKGTDALKPFWLRLRRSRARIEAVATDMSHAYIRAVRDHLPEATLVFDRFASTSSSSCTTSSPISGGT